MNEQKRHTFHYNLLSQPCPGFGGGYGGMFSFIVDTKANLNCFFKCPEILKDDAVNVLHSTCQQLWKTQQWPQDCKRSVFTPIPKKGNAKECSNYCTIELISHTSKVMLKILQARLQQYVNCELPDVQAAFEKAEEPEIKLPTSLDHQKSKRVPAKHLFLLY